MLNRKFFCFTWSVICVVFGMLGAFGVPAVGQAVPAIHVGSEQITGLPDDWTHHHAVFSEPGTEQDAISAGRHEQWQKIVNDPRYVIQQLRRNLPVQGPAAVDAAYRAKWIAEVYDNGGARFERTENVRPAFGFRGQFPRGNNPRDTGPNPLTNIKRDWSMALGGPGLAEGHYPAKYSFSTTTASCSDYVIFPTGAAGSTTQATIAAFTNIYVGGCVYNYNVTAGAASGTPVAGLQENGGTSGFIIDNQSTSQAGAQQVYFSTLTGHTAVQASQAGLQ